jgi:pyruvate dehydrogenase E1 component beta subunit
MIALAEKSTLPTQGGTVRMTYLQALVAGQIEEMQRDERVIIMGEDIAVYGGGELVKQIPKERIWSTPISETSFTGAAIGAAVTGLRPIVDLNIASFMYLAADPIINQAAKLKFMSGGQLSVPVVFRCCMFYGNSVAAQHSDRPYPLFVNVPGLKILCPTTPRDIKGLVKSAIRDDDPVLIFEDTRLWSLTGDVPEDPEALIPIGVADVRRTGDDVTLLAIGGAMRAAEAAAKSLAKDGISVELIDPRTLKPFDYDTVLASVAKTGHLVLVENAHRIANMSAEIAATVAEFAFVDLKAPILRLSAPDCHVAFAPGLEARLYPDANRIAQAVRASLQEGPR